MENTLWYLMGLLTLPAVWGLLLLWVWLTDKNWEVECLRCRRYFGEIGETYVRVIRLQFRWHRISGECRRNSK